MTSNVVLRRLLGWELLAILFVVATWRVTRSNAGLLYSLPFFLVAQLGLVLALMGAWWNLQSLRAPRPLAYAEIKLSDLSAEERDVIAKIMYTAHVRQHRARTKAGQHAGHGYDGEEGGA